jgi:hypothetical protein
MGFKDTMRSGVERRLARISLRANKLAKGDGATAALILFTLLASIMIAAAVGIQYGYITSASFLNLTADEAGFWGVVSAIVAGIIYFFA